MKKVIIALLVLSLLAFGYEKKYSLSLTEPEVNALLNVVDQSNAPHSQVKAVQEILLGQLRPQVDSVKKK
jgi:hypothetical protein